MFTDFELGAFGSAGRSSRGVGVSALAWPLLRDEAMTRDHCATAVTMAFFALTAIAWADSLPGSRRADEALKLCKAAERAAEAERAAPLDRGLRLAEAAIQADDADAKAHFAVFCNLGRRMQLEPLSLKSLSSVRRLRNEIDRTLELAPNSVDALTAKGAFLMELPPFLGRDADEAERLLRRALAVDPHAPYARRTLAKLTEQRADR